MNTRLINDRGVQIITIWDILGFISAINIILFIVVGPLTFIFPSINQLLSTQIKFIWAISVIVSIVIMYRWLQ
jgi:hypothetical protein